MRSEQVANVTEILAKLKRERDQIQHAIRCLEELINAREREKAPAPEELRKASKHLGR